MFFQSVYYLNAGEGSRRSKRFYIGFSATLMALITIALACNLFFGQEMWIEHRDEVWGYGQGTYDHVLMRPSF
jgi:hypothetical protein